MKKLLATSALVSMIAAPALAEVKIAGSIETTFGDKEATSTTAPASKGAAIGHETKFEFNSKAELSNGWTTSLDMEIMEIAGTVADTEIAISNGEGLSFYISKDGGSFHDWTVVPGAYNARPSDNVSNDSATMDAITIHGSHNFGVGYKTDFGTFGVRYAPEYNNTTNEDKAAGAGNGSGMEYGFTGNLGVDGLSVGISRAEIQNAQTNINTDDAKSTHYGIAYNFGQFAVGAERTTFKDKNGADGSTSTSTNDKDYTLYGVTYAATDNITLGINLATTEEDTTTADEETTQLEVAYNLGGATLAFSHQQTENDGGTSGKDGDAWSITYKQSF